MRNKLIGVFEIILSSLTMVIGVFYMNVFERAVPGSDITESMLVACTTLSIGLILIGGYFAYRGGRRFWRNDLQR